MIKVIVIKNRADRITGFKVRGHSGFAEEGQDIVCAAVSTLLQTALVGIKEILKLRASFISRKGFLRLTLPEHIQAGKASRAYFLTQTIYNSLCDIRRDHYKYIIIEEVFPESGKN